MTDEERTGTQDDRLRGTLSRAQILRAAGAGLAFAALPGLAGADSTSSTGGGSPGFSFPYYPTVPSGTYTPESPQEIIANLLTLKYSDTALGAFSLGNPTL